VGILPGVLAITGGDKMIKECEVKGTEIEKYINMVRKAAWAAVKKYHMEYEEAEAVGWEIYCDAIARYDVTKSRFGTFLYSRLRGILDEGWRFARHTRMEQSQVQGRGEDSVDVIDTAPAREELAQRDELLAEARPYLSSFAFRVLKFIIEREWKGEINCKKVCKRFAVDLGTAERAWKEIANLVRGGVLCLGI
jgi:hypothetical protein